jgi:hypothetical protein
MGGLICPSVAGVQQMPIKRSLEQPIINSIIRYAYALRKDEEAALLSAFLAISYHIHREAVESMLSPEKYEQLISSRMPAADTEESFIEIASEPVYREPLIVGHIRYVIATISNVPGSLKSAVITPIQSAVTNPVESVITRLRRSIRLMSRRRRENILQEEEELALFSTIEGVADQVNREAMESEILADSNGKGRFAAAYEQTGQEALGATGVSISEVIAARGGKNTAAKRILRPRDTYIEFMDEELMITRRIIDRNRAVSQGYLNARAM